MITINQLNKANQNLTNSFAKIKELKEGCEKETRSLKYDVYGPKIDKLKAELSKKTYEIEKRIEEAVKATQEEIDTNRAVTNEAKKIFTLMEIAKSEEAVRGDKKTTVYKYSDRDAQGNYVSNKVKITFDPVATVYEDDYTSVQAFIVPNRKPVNKFALILRGYSIFGHHSYSLFFTRGGYITNVHDDTCNIELNIKDARTEKELQEYLEKNEKKIRNMLPPELFTLPEEYEECIKLWEDSNWEIAYLEDKKYYYEHQYSHGESTPEYKAIIKRLTELQ